MKSIILVLATSAVLLALATTAVAVTNFTEVAVAAGIGGDTYDSNSGHVLGVCWIDFNNDLFPDLFFTNGHTRASHLFENDGDGTFTKVDSLLPDLLVSVGEMAGCVFADYDNDGDPDLYIQKISHQWSLNGANAKDGARNLLLKNLWVENGNQTVPGQALFQEVAATAEVAGVVDPPFGSTYDARRSMTGGWLDYDLDGCVDLFVGQFVLQNGGHLANLDTLYRNECDGTFADTTSVMNPGTDTDSLRPALGFIGAHLDDDLWPDMYVVNAHEPSPHFWDQLYQNNGDGTFTEILDDMTGIGDDSGSGMGIDVADIDLNGTWDIYITDRKVPAFDAEPWGNVLYIGNGGGTFQDNSAPSAGVEATFSWGTNFFDADHDGDEDLLIGHHGDIYHRNNGSGSFTRPSVGVETEEKVIGSAIADYDRDGDLDIVVNHQGARPYLFRNDSTEIGNWLQIKLVGVDSNRDAINAVVVITVDGQTQKRQVKGGSSEHSQDDLVVHFGLGSATTVDSVEVFWPHTDGTVDLLLDVSANQRISITEGDAPTCLIDVDLVLPQVDIDTTELFEACNTITASGLTVLGTGDLTLRAGEAVILGDGFGVAQDGLLVVGNDPDITGP